MKAPCEHGQYDAHAFLSPGADPESSIAYQDCPGGVKLDVDVEVLAYIIGLHVVLDDYAVQGDPMMLHDAAKAVLAALEGKDCDGSQSCEAATHIHGCYADRRRDDSHFAALDGEEA